MQGQLQGKYLTFTIKTECGHCQRPMHIVMDSEMKYNVVEEMAAPMVYTPLLDVHELEPSIIDGF